MSSRFFQMDRRTHRNHKGKVSQKPECAQSEVIKFRERKSYLKKKKKIVGVPFAYEVYWNQISRKLKKFWGDTF